MLPTGYRPWVISCILVTIVTVTTFSRAAEAAENMQAWKFTYLLHPVANQDEAESIIFTESSTFSKIDRIGTSFIIDYRQQRIHRLDHHQKTVCSSVPGQGKGINRQLFTLLGKYKTEWSTSRQDINGYQVQKVHLHFGSGMAHYRTMAPPSVIYIGEIFREQTVTAWITENFHDWDSISALINSHADFYQDNPLLLQLDTPALFTILGGVIVRHEHTRNNRKFVMDLKNIEAVDVSPDTFTIPTHFTSVTCSQ